MQNETINGISEKQAANIVARLFAGDKTEIKITEVVPGLLSKKTFYNYNPALKTFGFTHSVYGSRTNRNKITAIRLTEKGRQVIAERNPIPVSNSGRPRKQELSLDYVTKVTDEFNRQSDVWEWKLTRKETTNRS